MGVVSKRQQATESPGMDAGAISNHPTGCFPNAIVMKGWLETAAYPLFLGVRIYVLRYLGYLKIIELRFFYH